MYEKKRDDARAALQKQLEELSWRLGIAETVAATPPPIPSGYDSKSVFHLICDAVDHAHEAVKEFEEWDFEEYHNDEIRAVKRCLTELSMVGLTNGSASPRSHEAILGSVPSVIRATIENIAKKIRAHQDGVAQRKLDYEEAQKAIKHDVLLEWVRRNPGKGCRRVYDPYESDVTYDHMDATRQSWTDCVIFRFTGPSPGNDIWVIQKTFQHVEWDGPLQSNYEILTAAQAANELLVSDVNLDVEELVELRKLAGESTESKQPDGPAIVWNRELGELTIDGKIARKISGVNKAKNCVKILDTFQELDWPTRVDSPFYDDEKNKGTLRETISELNSRSTGIRFKADGNGQGVIYLLKGEPEVGGPQSDSAELPF